MSSMITRRQLNTGALGLGAAALGVAGGFPHQAQAADELNFQAIWLNDPEFLGYMIGIDKGYYAAEGLKVNYFPGGPNLVQSPPIRQSGHRADQHRRCSDRGVAKGRSAQNPWYAIPEEPGRRDQP